MRTLAPGGRPGRKGWSTVDAPRWDRRGNAPRALALALGAAALIALTGCAPTAESAATPAATPAVSQSPDASAGPAPGTAAPEADVEPVGPTIAPGTTSVPAPGTFDGADGPTEAAALPTTTARLDEPIAFDTGVVVEIVALEAIAVTAETPGEVSGPALRVRVAARNDSGQPQEVDSAVVSVVADDGEVGIGTTAGSPSPLAGVLEPGGTASGTYVFMLDPASGRDVTVSVNYAAGEPLAVFTGSIL